MARRRSWKSRIVGHDEIDPKTLLANPYNYRIHPEYQSEAIAGSLDEIGWIDDITVNQRTGFIVDGHERWRLALEHKEPLLPVAYVDLSEQEERKVLATFHPIGEMAMTDAAMQAELLATIDIEESVLAGVLDEMQAEAAFAEELRVALGSNLPMSGDGKTGRAIYQSRLQMVRMLVYVDQVAIVEAAIQKAGIPNRGEALVSICEAFLEE